MCADQWNVSDFVDIPRYSRGCRVQLAISTCFGRTEATEQGFVSSPKTAELSFQRID